MTPEEREEIEKEIHAIQEELGIDPSEIVEVPPTALADSYDRISDLYHRRKHLMAKLATNNADLCDAGAPRYDGLERRTSERRKVPDRRRVRRRDRHA